MSKKHKYKGETMSTESQETKEAQAVDLNVEQPKEAAPEIVQEAAVETPAAVTQPKSEEVAKQIATEEAAKATARIAQKPGKTNVDALQSDNPRVRQFAYQVNQYIALCNKPCVSEAALKAKLEQFTYIIRVIINSTDPAVYSAAYQFFKNHRKDILAESCVLQHVHVLPTELSIRVQTIYTTFMELVAANVDKKPFRLDYGLIRDNMKLAPHHPLLNWIRNRLSR